MRLNPGEVDEIKSAIRVGLYPMYALDNYVWLVNNGKDGEWHGFYGNVNKDIKAPYLLCPVHTEEAWEKYQEEKKKEEEATEPSEPEEGETPETGNP